jgi:hypothetical protein
VEGERCDGEKGCVERGGRGGRGGFGTEAVLDDMIVELCLFAGVSMENTEETAA